MISTRLSRLPSLLSLMLMVCLVSTSRQAFAQCNVYEDALEAMFFDYEPGTPVKIRTVEKWYVRCDKPTEKMELIYQFFKSSDAATNEMLTDRAAYEDASFYFDQAVPHFPYLWNTAPELQAFISLYYERMEELESHLWSEANRLRIKRERRMSAEVQQNSARGNENEPNVEAPKPIRSGASDVVRGQESPLPIQGTSENRREKKTILGETYGTIGKISDVNIRSYMAWKQQVNRHLKNQQESESVAAPAGGEGRRLRNPEIEEVETVPESNHYAVSQHGLPLYQGPGVGSVLVGNLTFGAYVYLVEGEQTVTTSGKTYARIQARNGKSGWAELAGLVKAGEVAVLLRPIQGFSRLSDMGRNAPSQTLAPADLVILEDTARGNVLVVSQKDGMHVWLPGYSALSLDPVEIEIANRIHEAMAITALYVRKSKLIEIRSMEGFEDSVLKKYVYDLLAATQ
ncbi:hypothetical protein [Pontibacter sp. G13]|uniref:hypothetical protein n=1 Tax=Pontibacter sp. G13 TaxID=3074898 RepID=UPI002889E449|nr:hypothetical protein [Pontibacter sp. G13]WNJ16005.1 hypothetical protein RJD25_14175 [Pontibacter sp. G13]